MTQPDKGEYVYKTDYLSAMMEPKCLISEWDKKQGWEVVSITPAKEVRIYYTVLKRRKKE